MNKKSIKKYTYKNSGVSINAADNFINKIKPLVCKTHNKRVLDNIGGFAGLYDISNFNYRNPVLVSGTDGVGTKLNLALKINKLDTIGIDLVAMCVNDIVTTGAKPLFFLDYYATGKLNVNKAHEIIKGIYKGCKNSNIALIGGETAEMPILYKKGDFDLAGFSVGLVDKHKILPKKVSPGDILIGVKSDGLHSNGYSLINLLIKEKKIKLNDKLGNKYLKDLLIKPTKIYTNLINLKNLKDIKSMANITGGGLSENIPRVLSNKTSAIINKNLLCRSSLYKYIVEKKIISQNEMYKTFNCGIGMVLIVSNSKANLTVKNLKKIGFSSSIIGHVQKSKFKKVFYENNL